MFDEGGFYFEIFVCIERKVFLAESVLLEEVYGAVVGGWVGGGVP